MICPDPEAHESIEQTEHDVAYWRGKCEKWEKFAVEWRNFMDANLQPHYAHAYVFAEFDRRVSELEA